MSLSRYLLGVLALMACAACADDAVANDSGSGAAEAGGGSPGSSGAGGASNGRGGAAGGSKNGAPELCNPLNCAMPPGSAGGPPPDGTTANIQAITTLYLGDTDRSGVASATAWESFGFAISGTLFDDSKASAAAHCKPIGGATAGGVVANGPGAVDNSFGKNLVPGLLALDSAFPAKTQQAILQGRFTTLISVADLGTASFYQGVVATVLPVVGATGADGSVQAPSNWATYAWSPLEGLSTIFPSGYVVDGRWVSGPVGEVRVTIAFRDAAVPLRIHHARLSHHYALDHLEAAGGVISGVLDPDELWAALRLALPDEICGSQVIETFEATHIDGARDIGLDGSQDPDRVCDGISIGLGYDSTSSVLGAVVAPPAEVSPCPGM